MTGIAEASPRRVLPEGRFAGPMPWVIAIMVLLSVLSAAAGLAVLHAAASMQSAIAGRVTIQIVEPNPDVRVRLRTALVGELRRTPNVADVEVVADEKVRDLLAPWLGSDGLDADLPMPALVDATLADASPEALAVLQRSVAKIVPSARIDRHADWLNPLADLLATLKWLALALVFLTAGATAAAVVLGSRAALDQHRATIDVMHLMGATDRQISSLFERRVSQDAFSGAALGFVVALGILVVVGLRVQNVGAMLVSQASLAWVDWALLLLIPIGGVGLAILSARVTVLRSLAHIL
jgi:cell division transport system permease protein